MKVNKKPPGKTVSLAYVEGVKKIVVSVVVSRTLAEALDYVEQLSASGDADASAAIELLSVLAKRYARKPKEQV